MAGHSKWANIKHRKGAQDKRRAKLFTRILREITIASRDGGTNPESNPALRLAMQNARGANIPKDKIENAINKATGGEGDNFQEHSYEGYSNGGVGIYIETTTDNVNRTVANIRSIFLKAGGSLGTKGSLSFIFSPKGVFTILNEKIAGIDPEKFEFDIIDAGAEEIEQTDEKTEIICSFENFGNMQKKLDEFKVEVEEAGIQQIPILYKHLELTEALKVLRMIDKLEDDDDVNTVYHNLELTPEIIEALEEN
ncbi:MAG: YebC/PmpR family DNA-binding transcriptional regulator [Flavobacteriales bacterium]|nr:YebC/PmpR family DNA-binding transcriptional regulator [Flavobacteriales bacterium]